MKKRRICFLIAVCICSMFLFSLRTFAQEALELLIQQYDDYESRFAAIENIDQIEENGFFKIENQSFPVLLETFGEEEITFLPIVDAKYNRLGILLADSRGNIVFKTNQLETNHRHLGELAQPTKGIASVAFQDLNQDGLTDIILITDCEVTTGDYAGKLYKVGDVLFQREASFYRDWRISDKINRFSMNKSADFIAAYVKEGNSTEILYTATTMDELLEAGFQVVEEQAYYRQFEKQGFLRVVPGVIEMAEYDVFMIYLVNEQGYIVWSFQPMGDYDNLYALKGMTCRDMDGDGMKDLLVLGRYSYQSSEGELVIDTKCDVYYQRTDGFDKDINFTETYQCTEEDTVEGLVAIIRQYWGWKIEE